MVLFSQPFDPWSHRTRIVIAEKQIEIDIVQVEPGKLFSPNSGQFEGRICSI